MFTYISNYIIFLFYLIVLIGKTAQRGGFKHVDLDLDQLCSGCSIKHLVANPKSNQTYIQCNFGDECEPDSIASCNNGLIFDAEKLTCDYPICVKDRRSVSYSPRNINFSCGGPDCHDYNLNLNRLCSGCLETHLVANPKNPNGYIQCNSNKGYRNFVAISKRQGEANIPETCSSGLIFNDKTCTCDFNCPTEDIAATSCLGPKDCLYPYLESCNSYIQCQVNADNTTGSVVVRPCPSGLEWNDNEKICDWPENSTCNGKNRNT